MCEGESRHYAPCCRRLTHLCCLSRRSSRQEREGEIPAPAATKLPGPAPGVTRQNLPQSRSYYSTLSSLRLKPDLPPSRKSHSGSPLKLASLLASVFPTRPRPTCTAHATPPLLPTFHAPLTPLPAIPLHGAYPFPVLSALKSPLTHPLPTLLLAHPTHHSPFPSQSASPLPSYTLSTTHLYKPLHPYPRPITPLSPRSIPLLLQTYTLPTHTHSRSLAC